MAATEPCREVGEVRDLMTPRPVSVPPDAAVGSVWQTMTERRFRHMPAATFSCQTEEDAGADGP